MKFSHRALATVLAFWFGVDVATAYFVKKSGMTRTFCVLLQSGSIVRKSMQSNSRGLVTWIFTRGAAFSGSVFLQTHLGQLLIFCSTSKAILGQKNLVHVRSRVWSVPRWPMSSWRCFKTICLRFSGRTSWYWVSSPACLFLYRIPFCNSSLASSRWRMGSSVISLRTVGGDVPLFRVDELSRLLQGHLSGFVLTLPPKY